MKQRLQLGLELIGAVMVAVGLLMLAIPFTLFALACRHLRWALIVIALLIASAAMVWGQSGMVLRGRLESGASDGSNYFHVGEAFVFFLPKDSALAPGIRALEGRKVVITILEDR